jgi:sugar phosphate isomerase/epimerase
MSLITRGLKDMIKIGNAPCSWGVEFADDPRNPSWRKVLQENAEAGFTGIELGPVGFMRSFPRRLKSLIKSLLAVLFSALSMTWTRGMM